MNDDNHSEQKTNLIDAIKCAYRNGLSIVPPMGDGSKRPFSGVLRPYQDSQPTEPELIDCYNQNNFTGIGYRCGAESDNMEVMDFHGEDIYEDYFIEAFDTELAKLLSHIVKGYSDKSPNGMRIYYRCSEIGDSMTLAARPKLPVEMEHTNDKTQTLITIHGEGGYIIAAPSYGAVNPDGEYKIGHGGPNTIVTITPKERDALHRIGRGLDVPPLVETVDESDPMPLESNGSDTAGHDSNTGADSTSVDYAVLCRQQGHL